ncbi:MAG: DNA integrity scanning protein DisA nucleotide-binding domain protein [Planctomycetia bacterium]|nr:MAG: DNA integrity scanning protein DisA nucleotide-binding domain protein [Planctomycetia bacterium]
MPAGFYTVGPMWEQIESILQRLRGDAIESVAIVVELLLIGLSVNWCATVLGGTRGTRPLKGVLLILVVATLVVRVLTVQLSWTRLELLYRYFLFGLAFAALVAFQPELRRAVIRVGDVRLRRRRAPQARLVGSLTKAAALLSRNRHGALIAIQRGVDLRGWAENGTLINADASSNLICSIFHPKTPLHDLGLIVREGRVLAANCQFPIAESDEVDAALGSRHLAAIGMSYETDALVLVVSEETGAISLADNGTLTRLGGPEELAVELERRLSAGPGAASDGRIGSLAWRIVRRALVVVPLTAIIWYVADQATQITATNVPVELALQSDPQVSVQLLEPANPVFGVTVRGTTRAVDRLRAQAARGPIKLTWTAPSTPARYVLRADEVISSALRGSGLGVFDAQPAGIVAVVDEVQTVTMRVRVSSGAARVADERVEPAEVRVTMRAADLAALPEARRVIEVRVEDRLRDVAAPSELTLPRVPMERSIDRFPLLRVEPPDVAVTLRVVEQLTRRAVAGIPVQLSVSPQVWRRYDVVLSDPNELLIDLDVEGDKALIEALRPQDVRAWVSVTGAMAAGGPEFRTVDVIVQPPTGVTVVGPPPTVRLRLEERP